MPRLARLDLPGARTEAARVLGVSQPAVSQQVVKLRAAPSWRCASAGPDRGVAGFSRIRA